MIDTSKIEARFQSEPQFQSLHHFFLNAANNIHNPSRPYLFQKITGIWTEFTYAYLLEQIDAVTSYLISHGLEKGDRVAILLENCPQYYVLDQSLQKLGLVNVSIYPTLTPEETSFIINDSGSKMLFVGNNFLLKKFLKTEETCPTIEKVIYVPSDHEETEKVLNYSSIIEQGAASFSGNKEKIEAQFHSVGKEDLATLIYTVTTLKRMPARTITERICVDLPFHIYTISYLGPNGLFLFPSRKLWY
jgi:long-chain acyl-CoA synthetase